MTSYTNARPGAGLLVMDLDLCMASGLVLVAGHSALCSELPVRHR